MTTLNRVLIAANPKSGAGPSGQKVAELNASLQERGFQSQLLYSLAEVQQQSMEALATGQLRAVVAAGGDGTVGALANLLPHNTPMLVFPLGTENLLAKHIGMTDHIGQACDAIVANRRFDMDLGCANGRYFLVMLSIGFDAQVVREMSALRTGHISRWSYTKPIITSLFKYSFPQLPYVIDGNDSELASAAWIFVFNVPRYAASLNFCPQANPCDGKLDVCTFTKSGIAWGVGYLSRLRFGLHQSMRGFRHSLATELAVRCPTIQRVASPISVPYQIDGDPGGELPLKVEVLRNKLTLLQPPGVGP
ncbi:MAG: NAD(+)/NADH kinase [Planctomycetales bacterium]|nr:NAD(+)/NADH kinase [Planctomycetales bacterium]